MHRGRNFGNTEDAAIACWTRGNEHPIDALCGKGFRSVTSAVTETGRDERPRRGRPRKDETGLANGRIIDAATELFLEQGFGRTTLDQVSELSRSGKSTLYGSYPNKEALFAAVVERSIDAMFGDLVPADPLDDVDGRLRHAGGELIRNMLEPRCVALMRITAAEASNLPRLAKMGYDSSFRGSVEYASRTLVVSPADIDQSTMDVAARFVELALHSVSFQATFGRDAETLLRRGVRDVDDAILLLRSTGRLDAYSTNASRRRAGASSAVPN